MNLVVRFYKNRVLDGTLASQAYRRGSVVLLGDLGLFFADGTHLDQHRQLFVVHIDGLRAGRILFAAAVDESDSVLDTPIEELDLSVRSYNCLKRQGVNSIGQLTECTEADLLNIRNFGAKSIEEVKDKLQQMGLGLKQ